MNGQIVVYMLNEILFGHKKEQSTDTQHNMDESWKHYAQWKEQVQKITYVWPHLPEMFRIDKSTETECRMLAARSLGEGKGSDCLKDKRLYFGVMEMFWN